MSSESVINSFESKPAFNISPPCPTGNRLISELISQLRSAFRPAEFDQVERILVAREENLKMDVKELKKQVTALGKQYDEMEKKHGELAFEKLELEDEVKKYQRECDDLKEKLTHSNEDVKVWSDRASRTKERYAKLYSDFDKEKNEKKEAIFELNEKIVELKIEKSNAEDLAKRWKKSYVQCEPRIKKLEEDVVMLMSLERKKEEDESPVTEVNCLKDAVVGNCEAELGQPQNKGSLSNCEENIHNLPQAGSTSNSPVIEVNGSPEADSHYSDMACCDGGAIKKQLVFESGGLNEMMGSSRTGSVKTGFRDVIEIDDSDYERPTGDGTASAPNTGEDNGRSCLKNDVLPSMPKRKHALTCNINNGDSGDDGIPQIGKRRMKCLEEVGLESKPDMGGRNNTAQAVHPSSHNQLFARCCEENPNHKSLNFPSMSDTDDSSDSDDEDITDSFMDNLVAGKMESKAWAYEADMLHAFERDDELCMNAVCALYRQQKSVKDPISSNNRGFNHSVALRGSALAEFLTNGDRQGKLWKTVSELQQYDSKAVAECRMLANRHYKQLFQIYQKKEDPFFHPS